MDEEWMREENGCGNDPLVVVDPLPTPLTIDGADSKCNPINEVMFWFPSSSMCKHVMEL